MPPPPPVGASGYAPPSLLREHPRGTTILVLGVLSLFTCGLVGPFAWALGSKALREIDSGAGFWINRGNVVAGRACGIITTCVLPMVVFCGILVVLTATTSVLR